MTLPASGAISLANNSGDTTTQSVNKELGKASPYNQTVSLNDTAVRTLAGVASGAISMSNLRGKSSAFVFSQTISANTQNYNLRAAAVAAGWNQTTPLSATVTINSGVVVGSASTGSFAFDTGVTFPSGTILAVVNNGYIVGRGGDGSNGGQGVAVGNSGTVAAGAAGGPAFRAQYAVSITNNGTIGGGGGGGGGGGFYQNYLGWDGQLWDLQNGSGGGGGAGNTVGSAGAGTGYSGSGGGNPGTLTAGGAGGPTSGGFGGGGAGGALGSSGGAGQNGGGNPEVYGGAGGAGGACTSGNANITWVATGTRLGTLG